LGAVIGLILTLVILEGLLSADNALVLAVMTGKLPVNQQKKALFYGMWGAILFRAAIIFVWAFISHWDYLWTIKAAGALYLAFLSIKGILEKKKEFEEEVEQEENAVQRFFSKFGLTTFVVTVIAVELMDIAFSVDSILAAFALSSNFWILVTGGILGILMMRSVAGVFQKLIEKIPELEKTAFVLILIIAIKMFATITDKVGELFGQHWGSYETPDMLFFGVLIIAFLLTFVVHAVRKPKGDKNVTA
jgi:YkoY family integral membrane protein